jgi:glycogen debranching enzyme
MNDLVKILDGSTFVVSDRSGDFEPSPEFPTGLFALDTRYLSRWILTLNGQRLSALSVDDPQYFEARFFLVPRGAARYGDATLSIIRERMLGGSFDEELTIINHDGQRADLVVRLEVGSDFADLFEVRDLPPKQGQIRVRPEDGGLRFSYVRGNFQRDTLISSSVPAQVDNQGLTFEVRIEPYGQWATSLHVEALPQPAQPPRREFGRSMLDYQVESRARIRGELDQWLSNAPRLVCDSDPLERAYRRSLTDLAALRYYPPGWPDKVLAAGLPWFMVGLGRDHILTSIQALPFAPDLARSTLRALVRIQGCKLDDFREEEPGKVFHELRYGELPAFEEQPHSPYFGSADATPLFVVLIDEYARWSGDADLVRELEQEARAALHWLDTYADIVGDGYVWYMRRNEKTGLENQCWKDSWNSISYRDGRIPAGPRATCELQGYAYDARMRGARLAREFWQDPGYADHLERQAADLKERFNRDYWVEDGQYYALARDADGGQVDALSSNIGHLLWSGIVDPPRATHVARHLLGPRLFSGWGVRTLAEGEGRYNPVGYHVGTVWPFDNSFIAWGLREYGFHDEAARITEAIIDAADYFQGRLPEAFAGYRRGWSRYPVEYPSASSPRALSTATPLLLLRTMLGLNPVDGHLAVNPALPQGVTRIELLDIPGQWGRFDALGRQ